MWALFVSVWRYASKDCEKKFLWQLFFLLDSFSLRDLSNSASLCPDYFWRFPKNWFRIVSNIDDVLPLNSFVVWKHLAPPNDISVLGILGFWKRVRLFFDVLVVIWFTLYPQSFTFASPAVIFLQGSWPAPL